MVPEFSDIAVFSNFTKRKFETPVGIEPTCTLCKEVFLPYGVCKEKGYFQGTLFIFTTGHDIPSLISIKVSPPYC